MRNFMKISKNVLPRILVTAVIGVLVSGNVQSADQPTPEERAYKFRTSLFQTFSWKFGNLVGAKKGGDEVAFAKHAGDLTHLSTLLEEGFQIENSLPEGTAAKPEIWEDYDKFKDRAANLNKMATALTEAGAMAGFDPRDFGSKACGSCHRDFRIKDDE
jgi:cytochrome c556